MATIARATDTRRLYAQVARALATEIADGTHPVGMRLPSERDIAARFGVSRPTVREAILSLELDGLVDVRIGSGVYVLKRQPPPGKAEASDFGPFEILEARLLIEGEACALAASLIDEAQLAELGVLLAEMDSENARDVERAEDADRRFHLGIAQATQNSALVATVEMLWAARNRSPHYRLLSEKVRKLGVKPRIGEHCAIVAALKARSPDDARAAMRDHLQRVIDNLLNATESEAIEQALANVEAKRRRYAGRPA